jgi:hypothetical protein
LRAPRYALPGTQYAESGVARTDETAVLFTSIRSKITAVTSRPDRIVAHASIRRMMRHRLPGNDDRGLFCNPSGLYLIYINSS